MKTWYLSGSVKNDKTAIKKVERGFKIGPNTELSFQIFSPGTWSPQH